MLAIKGVVGQIKWSYYIAAAIHGYAISRTPEGAWMARGTVVMADAYKMSQKPLMFVAPHVSHDPQGQKIEREWRWPIVELEIKDGQFTARLGALEESQ